MSPAVSQSQGELLRLLKITNLFGFGSVPPALAGGREVIKLLLQDERGAVLSENFYWYATEKAGYRKLNDMGAVSIEGVARKIIEAGVSHVEVDLLNRGQGIALFCEVSLRKQDGKRVLPVYASDNFVSLLPGERRRIILEFPQTQSGASMQVSLTGWSVRRTTVPVQ